MRRGHNTTSFRSSIRGPAVRLALGIAIAAGLTFFAINWLKAEEASQQTAQAHLADAQQRVATALEDRRDLAAYKSAYDALVQNHVIGKEERLPWIEHYTRLVELGNPVSLVLTMEPQRVFEMPPKQPLGDMQFYASHLSLEAELNHEGDLYRLLAGLRSVTGAHIVRACDIGRKAGDSGSAENSARLDLKCDVDLMTLNKTAPPAGG